MYSKLVLNRPKIIRDSIFIYTHCALNSKKLFKKISTYVCPMFTNVLKYVHLTTSIHVRTNSEL